MMRVNQASISDQILAGEQYDDATVDEMLCGVTAIYHRSNSAFLGKVLAVLDAMPEAQDVAATLRNRRDIYDRCADERDPMHMKFSVFGFMFKELSNIVDAMEQLGEGERVTSMLLRSKYVSEKITARMASAVERELQEETVMERIMTWNIMLQFILAAMTREQHRKEVVFLMPLVQSLRSFFELADDESVSEEQRSQQAQKIVQEVFQKQFERFGAGREDCDEMLQKITQRMPQLSGDRSGVMLPKLMRLLTKHSDPEEIKTRLPEILGQDVSKEFLNIMTEFKQKKQRQQKPHKGPKPPRNK